MKYFTHPHKYHQPSGLQVKQNLSTKGTDK